MSRPFAIAAPAAFLAFVALDALWLSQAVPALYRPELGGLLRDTPVLWAAALFYPLYGAGLALLAIRPALAVGSIRAGFWRGLVLGLVAYGTYDLTNLATLAGWSGLVTVVDMAWGTLLSGVAAAIGVAAARRLA